MRTRTFCVALVARLGSHPHEATEVGSVQFVGLQGGENRVDLSGDLDQLGDAALLLDMGPDPLLHFILGGCARSFIFQNRSAAQGVGGGSLALRGIRGRSTNMTFECVPERGTGGVMLVLDLSRLVLGGSSGVPGAMGESRSP